MTLIAAFPMYDWPECRSEVDQQWARLRSALIAEGLPAPERLAREIDLHSLWRHPDLLIAQTCWGPMGLGLEAQVIVLGQPDYSDVEGGQGALYSSAILMRTKDVQHAPAPQGREAHLPINDMRNKRLAFNSQDSMSGLIAFERDLEAQGESRGIFSERVETGGHRRSIQAVAQGKADVCSVDCRSWALAQRFEPSAENLRVVGWTAKRPGLPFITARTHASWVEKLRRALAETGMLAVEPTDAQRVAF